MADFFSSPINLLAGLVSGQVAPIDVPPYQWPELVPVACRQRLGPMLCYVLQQAGTLGALSEPDADFLRSEYHKATAENFLALAAAREWSQRFDRTGIPAVWIKGVPLSLTVYPQPGTRPMTDIDVMVAAGQVSGALHLVEAATGRRAVGLAASIDKHAVVDVGMASSVRMELHWSLVDPPTQPSTEDVQWFLRERQPLPGGGAFYGLASEAHLLYLCGHTEIVHGESDFLLLRYLDLHRLIEASPELDWAIVRDRAVDFGWTYAVERALQITQLFFGTPIPQSLLADLPRLRPAHEDVSRVTKLQGSMHRGDRLLTLFCGLSWTARLRLAAGMAFPSAEYMRRRYELDAGWKVPFYYPYRWLDTGQAVLRTLGKDRSRQTGQDS